MGGLENPKPERQKFEADEVMEILKTLEDGEVKNRVKSGVL